MKFGFFIVTKNEPHECKIEYEDKERVTKKYEKRKTARYTCQFVKSYISKHARMLTT